MWFPFAAVRDCFSLGPSTVVVYASVDFLFDSRGVKHNMLLIPFFSFMALYKDYSVVKLLFHLWYHIKLVQNGEGRTEQKPKMQYEYMQTHCVLNWGLDWVIYWWDSPLHPKKWNIISFQYHSIMLLYFLTPVGVNRRNNVPQVSVTFVSD